MCYGALMAHSVFGFRTYAASLQSGVARHAAGLVRPENAITRPGWPAVKDLLVDESTPGWPAVLDFEDTGWSTGADLGPADVSPFEPGTVPDEDGKRPPRRGKSSAVSRIERTLLRADRAMGGELAKPRRGKAPCRAVELMLAGPPPWDSPQAWPLEVVLAWARDSVQFVRESLPDAPIAAASLHLDEHSPHVHVTFAPIVHEGTKVKLGSRAVRAALAARAPAREERLKASHRDELSRAAAAYAHHVGARYGLAAGRVASTAQHVPVDPVEGARRRAETLEQRARVAERELEDRRREQLEAERRARVARGESERLENANHRAERRLDQLEHECQTVGDAVAELEESKRRFNGAVEESARKLERTRAAARKFETANAEAVRELEATREATREARAGEERAAAEAKQRRESDEAAADAARARAVELDEANARAAKALEAARADGERAVGHEREVRKREQFAPDQAQQLEAANVEAGRKLDAAVEAREREEQAAGEAKAAADTARKQREDYEAIAGGLAGWRARRGRDLVAGFEQRIESAERDRDAERKEHEATRASLVEVTAARDKAVKGWRYWHGQAQKLERERDALRARVPAPGEQVKREREVWQGGFAEGLRAAGVALGRVLRAVGVDVEHFPALSALLDALSTGAGGRVDAAVSSAEAPSRVFWTR